MRRVLLTLFIALSPAPRRTLATVIFWSGFYALGALVMLLTLRSFGEVSPVAILLQSSIAIWGLTVVLRLLRLTAAYLIAGTWILILGLPLTFQVIRRIHHWITIGMDSADGSGSPMAFLFGFIIEWIVYVSLCFMLGVLVVFRPWRNVESTTKKITQSAVTFFQQ